MKWQWRSTIKNFHLTAAVTVGIFGGLVWWTPGGIAGSDEGKEVGFVPLSERTMMELVPAEEVLGEAAPDAQIVIEVAKSEKTATPRVSPSDTVKAPSHVSADAPKSEASEEVIAERVAAGEENHESGLRTRLLVAASERALRSENPWTELSMVALAFKNLGNDEAARYWFERASRLAMDPDDSAKGSRAVREVVSNMLAGGYFDLAIALVDGIPLDSEKSQAKAELAVTLAGHKKFAEAYRLVDALVNSPAKTSALQGLAEAEARFRSLDSALLTLSNITDLGDRNLGLGRIAAIRNGLGDRNGALQTAHRITDPDLRNAAIAQTVDERSKNATVSKESQAMGQLREGNLDEALRRALEIPIDDRRFRTLQSIAVAMVRNEGVKMARKVVNLITDPTLREATFGKVAQQAALAGNPAGAAETVQYMGDPTGRAMAYAGIALTSARYGANHRAIHLVHDASRELTKVESPEIKAAARGILAEVFAETGDSGSALRAAASIPNEGLRDATYQKLALSFAKSDAPILAEESAQKIEGEDSRERALDSVAVTLAGRVPVADAMRYLSHIDGSRQQVRFLLGVAGRKG